MKDINRNERGLYLTFTPYHVLLATLVASSRSNGSNHLVIFPSFPRAVELVHFVSHALSWPFDHWDIRPCVHGASQWRRRLSTLRNLVYIKELVSQNRFQILVTAHDGRPESQLGSFLAKKYWDAKYYYLEDGAALYSEPRRGSRLFEGIYKQLFGSWWVGYIGHGMNPLLDGIFAVYPDLVPEDRHAPRIPLSLRSLLTIRTKRESLLSAFKEGNWQGSLERLQILDAIVFLGHSEMMTEHTMVRVESVLRWCKVQGLRFGIKYHPREISRYVKPHKTLEVPQWLPAELLFLITSENIKYIFGEASTVLLTARTLLPEDVRVVDFSGRRQDEQLARVMKHLSIEPFTASGRMS